MPLTDINDRIKQFLDGAPHAVVGASQNRAKYGNMVLRTYIQNARPVYAVNPHEASIEGVKSYPSLGDVPEPIHGISIITPPPITEKIIDQAIALGIRHFWLQPGAENRAALDLARSANANIIAEGPCILVVLGFQD